MIGTLSDHTLHLQFSILVNIVFNINFEKEMTSISIFFKGNRQSEFYFILDFHFFLIGMYLLVYLV